jgi:hypothetical protein
MIARLLIAAALMATALEGGAQAPPPGTSRKQCMASQPSCEVRVTVPAQCNACSPATDADYVEIEKGNKNQITWRLATPGYTFGKQNGIVFADDPSGDEFKCRAEQNGATYVCTNKHSTSGKTYKYTVNLAGPGAPNPLDPWVINR